MAMMGWWTTCIWLATASARMLWASCLRQFRLRNIHRELTPICYSCSCELWHHQKAVSKSYIVPHVHSLVQGLGLGRPGRLTGLDPAYPFFELASHEATPPLGISSRYEKFAKVCKAVYGICMCQKQGLQGPLSFGAHKKDEVCYRHFLLRSLPNGEVWRTGWTRVTRTWCR